VQKFEATAEIAMPTVPSPKRSQGVRCPGGDLEPRTEDRAPAPLIGPERPVNRRRTTARR